MIFILHTNINKYIVYKYALAVNLVMLSYTCIYTHVQTRIYTYVHTYTHTTPTNTPDLTRT